MTSGSELPLRKLITSLTIFVLQTTVRALSTRTEGERFQMKRKVWLAMFAGLVGCPLVAGAQQGAPVVCVGTPQFAAQAAIAAQNPGQGRGQAPAPARGTAPPPPDITTAEIPGVIAAGLKWT